MARLATTATQAWRRGEYGYTITALWAVQDNDIVQGLTLQLYHKVAYCASATVVSSLDAARDLVHLDIVFDSSKWTGRACIGKAGKRGLLSSAFLSLFLRLSTASFSPTGSAPRAVPASGTTQAIAQAFDLFLSSVRLFPKRRLPRPPTS